MQTHGTDVGGVPYKHDGTALAKYLRVKWTTTGTKLVAAGATEQEIGTLAEVVLTGADQATVIPLTAPTCKMVAAGAIAKGGLVYGAAGGKVSATVTARTIGQARQASTADGDIIEIARIPATAVPANS